MYGRLLAMTRIGALADLELAAWHWEDRGGVLVDTGVRGTFRLNRVAGEEQLVRKGRCARNLGACCLQVQARCLHCRCNSV